MKIGVFGSSTISNDDIALKAKEIGKIIASKNYQVLTGGVPGYPDVVAKAALEAGGRAIAYAAGKKLQDHNKFYEVDLSPYSQVIFQDNYFSNDFSRADLYVRSLDLVCNVDKAIVIGGRVGTMYELTMLSGLGKDIFVLEGSGGVTETTIKRFIEEGHKEKSKIIYFSSPKELLNL